MLVFIICVSIIAVVALAVAAWVCSFTWNRKPRGPDQVAALVTQAKELPMSHMPMHSRPQQFQRGSVAGIPFAPSPSDMGGMPPPPPFHHDMIDPEQGESKHSPDKQGYGNRGPGHTSHAMPPFYTPGATSNVFQPTPPTGPPRGSGAGLPDNSGSGMAGRGRLPPLRGAGDGRRLSGASAASDSGGGRARRGSNASGTFQQQASLAHAHAHAVHDGDGRAVVV